MITLFIHFVEFYTCIGMLLSVYALASDEAIEPLTQLYDEMRCVTVRGSFVLSCVLAYMAVISFSIVWLPHFVATSKRLQRRR